MITTKGVKYRQRFYIKKNEKTLKLNRIKIHKVIFTKQCLTEILLGIFNTYVHNILKNN